MEGDWNEGGCDRVSSGTLGDRLGRAAAASTLTQNLSWTIDRAGTSTRYRVTAYGDSIYAGYTGSLSSVALWAAPTVDGEYLQKLWNSDIQVVRRCKSGAVASDIYNNKIVAERSHMQTTDTRVVTFEMCGTTAPGPEQLRRQSGTCNYAPLDSALTTAPPTSRPRCSTSTPTPTRYEAKVVANLYYPGYDADNALSGCNDPAPPEDQQADEVPAYIAKMNCARATLPTLRFACADSFAQYMGADYDSNGDGQIDSDALRYVRASRRAPTSPALPPRCARPSATPTSTSSRRHELRHIQSDNTHPTFSGGTVWPASSVQRLGLGPAGLHRCPIVGGRTRCGPEGPRAWAGRSRSTTRPRRDRSRRSRTSSRAAPPRSRARDTRARRPVAPRRARGATTAASSAAPPRSPATRSRRAAVDGGGREIDGERPQPRSRADHVPLAPQAAVRDVLVELKRRRSGKAESGNWPGRVPPGRRPARACATRRPDARAPAARRAARAAASDRRARSPSGAAAPSAGGARTRTRQRTRHGVTSAIASSGTSTVSRADGSRAGPFRRPARRRARPDERRREPRMTVRNPNALNRIGGVTGVRCHHDQRQDQPRLAPLAPIRAATRRRRTAIGRGRAVPRRRSRRAVSRHRPRVPRLRE